MLDLHILSDGPFGTNCYIGRQEGRAFVVDPNYRLEPILDLLEGFKLDFILLTHAHIDHISMLTELKSKYKDVPVYIHKEEVPYLTDPSYNLSSLLLGVPYIYEGDYIILKDKDKLKFLQQDIYILYTPGHSLGSLSYYFIQDKILFSGDVLFQGSIGRTDFKGCNYEQLISSIKNSIYLLPDDTLIYSGHGFRTSIGVEKETNLFIK